MTAMSACGDKDSGKKKGTRHSGSEAAKAALYETRSDSSQTSDTVMDSVADSLESKNYPHDSFESCGTESVGLTDSEKADEPDNSDAAQAYKQTIKISSDWTDLECVFDDEFVKCGETEFKVLMNKGWYDYGKGLIFTGDHYADLPIGREPFFYRSPGDISGSAIKQNSAAVDIHNYDGFSTEYESAVITGFFCNATSRYLSGQKYPNVYISGGVTFGTPISTVYEMFGQPDSREDIGEYLYEPATNYSLDSETVTREFKSYPQEKITFVSDDKQLIFVVADEKVTGIGLRIDFNYGSQQ